MGCLQRKVDGSGHFRFLCDSADQIPVQGALSGKDQLDVVKPPHPSEQGLRGVSREINHFVLRAHVKDWSIFQVCCASAGKGVSEAQGRAKPRKWPPVKLDQTGFTSKPLLVSPKPGVVMVLAVLLGRFFAEPLQSQADQRLFGFRIVVRVGKKVDVGSSAEQWSRVVPR